MNGTKNTRSTVAATAAVVVIAGVVVAGTARAASATEPGVAGSVLATSDVTQYRLSVKQTKDVEAAAKLARSQHAKMIRNRESGGNYRINTGNGYYGAYQFDRGTWMSNGGGQFGKTADKAPKWAQDYIMFKTHEARGWSPWGG